MVRCRTARMVLKRSLKQVEEVYRVGQPSPNRLAKVSLVQCPKLRDLPTPPLLHKRQARPPWLKIRVCSRRDHFFSRDKIQMTVAHQLNPISTRRRKIYNHSTEVRSRQSLWSRPGCGRRNRVTGSSTFMRATVCLTSLGHLALRWTFVVQISLGSTVQMTSRLSKQATISRRRMGSSNRRSMKTSF